MADQLQMTFLRDLDHGGDPRQPAQVAAMLARFVRQAQRSLHVAIYDFRLQNPTLADPVVKAFRDAAARGVSVRIAYDKGKPALAQTTEAFAAAGADPAPVGTGDWLDQKFGGSAVELGPIGAPSGKLMHDKYIVRDGHTPLATVWTGSANFTDGAWTHQENNILRIASPSLAAAYEVDFLELWQSGNISTTGVNDEGAVHVHDGEIGYAFGPGGGPSIDVRLASLISAATSEVTVASMVLTSHTILGALLDAVGRGVKVWGIYDRGQMDPIVRRWETTPSSVVTAATFRQVATHLVGKRSAPYTPTGVHNFMHNKLLVVDGRRVATGSHNFSQNATGNAENSLLIGGQRVAAAYKAYVGRVVDAYAPLHEAVLTAADSSAELVGV
jgi:phosphatidylserine/phosphatidylglycerophosphate/cardiolipin synthase-like enzyme